MKKLKLCFTPSAIYRNLTVSTGAPAAMTAGCYAAPQFQFSGTPGGSTQQFFLSPQTASTAGGQTFLQWSAATPATPGALHFQTQSAQQTAPVAAAWQAMSTVGGALYTPQQAQQPQSQPPQQHSQQQQQQPSHQQQQQQQAVGSTLQPAGATAAAAQQTQILTHQASGTAVQMTQPHQQHQPMLFAPQHAVGLQAAGATQATAYPQQIYFAQAPAGILLFII